MKKLLIPIIAAAVAVAFAVPAGAVPSKKSRDLLAQHETSCKAQAAKKFSAIHFIKRKQFVDNCMGRTARAKAVIPHKATVKAARKTPTTTGQSVK